MIRVEFRIGEIEVQGIGFPDGVDRVLQEYLNQSGHTRSYVASIGVDSVPGPFDSSLTPALVHAYACVLELQEFPCSGLVVLSLAGALVDADRFETAKLVLDTLAAAGSPGCYQVWYEDPHFHLAWYAADLKKYDLSIDYYHRSIANPKLNRNWASWVHLGTVYHELGDFQKAKESYVSGLEQLASDDKTRSSVIERVMRNVKLLIDQAVTGVAFTGRRVQFGVEISER